MESSDTETSVEIWKKAVRFHFEHSLEVNFAFPLLFVPIVGDHLNSVLIRQFVTQGRLRLLGALLETLKESPRLLSMKLHFQLPALLWSIVPIWGWFKGAEYRIRWAMASNVIAFERYTGSAGRLRCIQRAMELNQKVAVRSMVTIPFVLQAALLIAMSVSFVLLPSSTFATMCLLGIWYLAIPLSGAANSFLYLTIPSVQLSVEAHDYPNNVLPEFLQFCTRCLHYNHIDGRCTLLSFVVRENPRTFQTECGGLQFDPASQLPENVTCPHCSTILQLEQKERERFEFTCEVCLTETKWQESTASSQGVA